MFVRNELFLTTTFLIIDQQVLQLSVRDRVMQQHCLERGASDDAAFQLIMKQYKWNKLKS